MTTAFDREDIIGKIQKLMALASRNDNEQQAGLAAAKVQELLTRYNIEMHEVEAAGKKIAEPVIGERVTGTSGKPQKEWEVRLAQAIARAYYCMGISINDGRGTQEFAGRKTDAAVAAYMYVQLNTRLTLLSQAAWRRYAAEYKDELGESIYKVKNHAYIRQQFVTSWLSGAALSIEARLDAQRAEANQSEAGTAMILVRSTDVDAYVKQQYPNLRYTTKKFTAKNGDAYRQGEEAGKRIELRQGLPGSNEPRKQLKAGRGGRL